MTSLSNKIQTTCRRLRDNDDDFFSKSDVLACRSATSDFSNVYEKEIQDFIFNNQGYDKDEWDKYKERCKDKLSNLKNEYNIENANVYYNCLIGEDSNAFGESVFGNRRNNFVKLNRDQYEGKKGEYENLEKEIMNVLNRSGENLNRNEIDKKMTRLDRLNTSIEENISDFKERILKDYKDREDLQYDQIVKNFRIIDVNNSIIEKMRDNISYINRKREIVMEKYDNIKKYYNIVLFLVVFLLLVNIGLGVYYFLIVNKKI
jgi:hypothetical protein